MQWLAELGRRLAWLFRGRRFDRDLEEELRLHLELKAEQHVAEGMDPVEARYAARRGFGNAARIAERTREVARFRWLDDLAADTRYAAHMLARSPAFAATVILSLALGIGANSAIFSLLDPIVLERLPVNRPEELVMATSVVRGHDDPTFSYEAYRTLREKGSGLAGMLAASNTRPVAARIGELSEPLRRKFVSGNYFTVLGVRPAAGRVIEEEDDRQPGGQPVAVLSHAFWLRRFGADPGVVGRGLRLEGEAFTIVGVAPPGFFGESVGESPDLWTPLAAQANAPAWLWSGHSVTWLRLLGRLAPGVSREQALAGHAGIYQQMQEQHAAAMKKTEFRADVAASRLRFEPASRGFSRLRGAFAQPLGILMAAVGLVLLVACANVGTLLLARAAARQPEIAARLSLGATRGRIVRQMLTESLVMALAGGTLGFLAASWIQTLLKRLFFIGPAASIVLDTTPGLRVLAFTAALSIATVLLSGLLPALAATKRRLAPQLHGARPTGSRLRLGRTLVASQVALSLILLSAAALFGRSLGQLARIDPGFSAENVLLVLVNTGATPYKGPALTALHARMLDSVRSVAGVRAASLAFSGVFGRDTWGQTIEIEGYTPAPNERVSTLANAVGPDYFATVAMPVAAGRPLGPADRAGAPPVAVVNEAWARRYAGSQSPIGRRFSLPRRPLVEIVGLVRDAKYTSLRDDVRPMTYFPIAQQELPAREIAVRTEEDPAALAAAVRRAVESADRAVTVLETTTLRAKVDASIAVDRLLAILSSSFGVVALALACVGLYGLMSYAVAGRTNEIGIRMALGADPARLLRSILAETSVLVLCGVAVGLPVSILAARAAAGGLAGLLYRTSPTDPTGALFSSALLAVVALAAGWVPARRAANLDPIEALRHE
jgi:predicted permease